MTKIMIVEDDRVLSRELSILLENAGYGTVCAENFRNVTKQMRESGADLVLLDINLPETNGEIIVQEFRKTCTTPVIMLTSRNSELDEVLSMSYGADDYITKPYNPTILLLHIASVLRRYSKNSTVMSYGNLTFNTVKGTLKSGECEQVLTKNEIIIFSVLLDSVGEIVTRDRLMTALWDSGEFISDNALSVNISRLRTKLAQLGLPDAIETRKKQGYILK